MAVAVFIFEDENAIAQVQIEFLAALRICVVFGDPQPSARVPSHRDWILHVGFGCENRGLEAGRQLHFRRRFDRRHRFAIARLGVVGDRKLSGAQAERHER